MKGINATWPAANMLDDKDLFELAAWINWRRTEVRREITKRAGSEVVVFIDCPPLDGLSEDELVELKLKAEELSENCWRLLREMAPNFLESKE